MDRASVTDTPPHAHTHTHTHTNTHNGLQAHIRAYWIQTGNRPGIDRADRQPGIDQARYRPGKTGRPNMRKRATEVFRCNEGGGLMVREGERGADEEPLYTR